MGRADRPGRGGRADRALRRAWISGRGGFYRLALLSLAAWGTYNLIGSSHGILRLHALGRQETALRARYAGLTEASRQVEYELEESPSLTVERGLREKYLKNRPDEIVYRARPVPADSAARLGVVGGAGGLDEGAGYGAEGLPGSVSEGGEVPGGGGSR